MPLYVTTVKDTCNGAKCCTHVQMTTQTAQLRWRPAVEYNAQEVSK